MHENSYEIKFVCWQTTLSQILYGETLIISHFILLCSVLHAALGNFYIDINITNENNFSVPFSSSPFFLLRPKLNTYLPSFKISFISSFSYSATTHKTYHHTLFVSPDTKTAAFKCSKNLCGNESLLHSIAVEVLYIVLFYCRLLLHMSLRSSKNETRMLYISIKFYELKLFKNNFMFSLSWQPCTCRCELSRDRYTTHIRSESNNKMYL